MAVVQELIQRTIHRMEEAGGSRYIKYALTVLAVIFLSIIYNFRCYRNFSTEESMDAAQVARNIANGKGYTTLYIRPLSISLVERNNRNHPGSHSDDLSELRSGHPDLANPPVYPAVLAGLMKAVPFDYTIAKAKPFWISNGRFLRYQPDFVIAAFNELLLLGVIALTAIWARRLFDATVGWTTAVLLLMSDLLWRYSTSGLSTMLLLLLFVVLIWCLTFFEREIREPKWGALGCFALAGGAGVLVGLAGLTRYSFAWLIVPLLVVMAVISGPRRVMFCLTAVFAFGIVMTPWMVRNYQVSGVPFGTATFNILQGTDQFPGNELERSLSPELRVPVSFLVAKLSANTRTILSGTLFHSLGGPWIAAFFFAGLLVPFRNPAIRRIRYFLMLSLGILIVVQALGRTQLSDDSPEINSDDLLVVLTPLICVYGVALFFVLLDQIKFPVPQLRYPAIALFGLIVCSPMVFALLPPRTNPVAYPPYHPLRIQQTANLLKETEFMMSDVPWAVAWYGQRQCVWLTLNVVPDPKTPGSQENFLAISDYRRPINGLYLTQKTIDSRFLTDWVHAGEFSWGSFILENVVLRKELPASFPLHAAENGYWPDQLFLSDWQRWR